MGDLSFASAMSGFKSTGLAIDLRKEVGLEIVYSLILEVTEDLKLVGLLCGDDCL
jgi:hypothetical protein